MTRASRSLATEFRATTLEWGGRGSAEVAERDRWLTLFGVYRPMSPALLYWTAPSRHRVWKPNFVALAEFLTVIILDWPSSSVSLTDAP